MEKIKNQKSLSLYAKNRDRNSGFDIYLGYPGGQREYVRTSRHNGLLYGIMQDGVKVEDLNRWLTGSARLTGVGDKKSRSRTAARIEGSVRQILRTVNEMVKEKEYDTISPGRQAASNAVRFK